MKRVILRVQYVKSKEVWKLFIVGQRICEYATKAIAVTNGRILARSYWQDQMIPAQLVIHKKNGVIESERTYGLDPRRFKG